MSSRPDVLLIMTDQQRFDTLACLGNRDIHTPNLDRLAARGTVFTNAYSTCPVCVPARYTIRSGCEPTRTDIWDNDSVTAGRHEEIEREIGPYLGRAMSERGYRSVGVGKFHTVPWNADVGLEVQHRSEELYESSAARDGDAYARWIAENHPEYSWIEALMGERTEMYYMPQMSPLPAELTVESWAADRIIEAMDESDPRPFFGFVSFIGPHPPFAPPLPYQRMYDPDRMSLPVKGDIETDHLDQHLPWMNSKTFAEDVDDDRARSLKARYYGEISYIDSCLGRILDAVERRPDPNNVVICFVSDHGELLGDHHAWQKESFFEASTKIPFLVSWPAQLPVGDERDDLVSLADLFGICTSAAGAPELRQGSDVVGLLQGSSPPRPRLFGFHGQPRTRKFKAMVREDRWKLIYLANGGHLLLFDMVDDPQELRSVADAHPQVVQRMRGSLIEELATEGRHDALDTDSDGRTVLWQQEYELWERDRIYQFDQSRGVDGFPLAPAQVHLEPSSRRTASAT